ncbi:MAG TPA: hypothetical protein VIK76_17080, partial [Pyrinomonadaceae bacterium]
EERLLNKTSPNLLNETSANLQSSTYALGADACCRTCTDNAGAIHEPKDNTNAQDISRKFATTTKRTTWRFGSDHGRIIHGGIIHGGIIHGRIDYTRRINHTERINHRRINHPATNNPRALDNAPTHSSADRYRQRPNTQHL